MKIIINTKTIITLRIDDVFWDYLKLLNLSMVTCSCLLLCLQSLLFEIVNQFNFQINFI